MQNGICRRTTIPRIFLRVAMSRHLSRRAFNQSLKCQWRPASGLGFHLGAMGEWGSGLRSGEARMERIGMYRGLGGFRSYGTNSVGNKDPYVILGFKTYNVTDEEIKTAYYRKHIEAHREKDLVKQKAMQQDLNNAKDEIMNPEGRREWHLRTGIPSCSNEPVRTPARLLEIAKEKAKDDDAKLTNERNEKEKAEKKAENEAIAKRLRKLKENKPQTVDGHRIIWDNNNFSKPAPRDKLTPRIRTWEDKARGGEEKLRKAQEYTKFKVQMPPERPYKPKPRLWNAKPPVQPAKVGSSVTDAQKLEQERQAKLKEMKERGFPIKEICVALIGVGLVGFTAAVVKWEEFFY